MKKKIGGVEVYKWSVDNVSCGVFGWARVSLFPVHVYLFYILTFYDVYFQYGDSPVGWEFFH